MNSSSSRIALLMLLVFLFPPCLQSLQGQTVAVELISVPTGAQARELRSRIEAGETFDSLARRYSTDSSGRNGGYLGRFVPGEMRGEFQDALEGLAPGEVSRAIPIGSQYFLLGILTDAEYRWVQAQETAQDALSAGNAPEVLASLDSAVELAGDFGPGDFRLLISLSSLADVRYAQGDYARAQPLYERWLAGAEQNPGMVEDNQVAGTLDRLGEIHRLRGDAAGAEPLLRRSLGMMQRGSPEVAELADGYRRLGRVEWALGNYGDAEQATGRAVEMLEAISTSEPFALATALNDLSRILSEQGKYAAAESAARRSLEICNQTLRPDHPAVAEGQVNLARVLRASGSYEESERLYRSALGAMTGVDPSANGERDDGLLTSLTAVFRHFRIRKAAFDEASASLRQTLEGMGNEILYHSITEILVRDENLRDLTLELISEAIESFPNSLTLRSELATVYANTGEVTEAIEAFSEVTRMPGIAADPARLAHSFQMIGFLEGARARFPEAEAAYRKALEVEPDNVLFRTGLGNMYFANGDFTQAREQYRYAIRLDPEGFEANFMLAQADLSLEDFAESADAAAVAMAANPLHPESRFVRARALTLMGETESAAAELERYRDLDAERDARTERTFELQKLRREADRELDSGRDERAIALYREAVESYPDEPSLMLALADLLSAAGQHQAAVDTLQEGVARGVDDFVVEGSLSEEYGLLGDAAAARDHRLSWLDQLYSELKDTL